MHLNIYETYWSSRDNYLSKYLSQLENINPNRSLIEHFEINWNKVHHAVKLNKFTWRISLENFKASTSKKQFVLSLTLKNPDNIEINTSSYMLIGFNDLKKTNLRNLTSRIITWYPWICKVYEYRILFRLMFWIQYHWGPTLYIPLVAYFSL